MPRQATAELCLKPETKKKLEAMKDDGVTWDYFLRRRLLNNR